MNDISMLLCIAGQSAAVVDEAGRFRVWLEGDLNP